jgi:GT2 family glycosyltransferase
MAGDCSGLMARCIDHLQRNAGGPVRLIVVDNGTPDAVGEAVDKAAVGFASYQRVRHEDNRGFTEACNAGIRAAGDCDVLLLNSDCRVAPNCIPLLRQAMTRREQVAAVGPLTLDDGDQSLRQPLRLQQAGLSRLPSEPVNQVALIRQLAENTLSEETRLAFFCTLLSRAAINAIGLLDEDPELQSGLGVDDFWCHKAGRAGWKVLVHHGAFADHDHSATFLLLGLDRDGLQRQARDALGRLDRCP